MPKKTMLFFITGLIIICAQGCETTRASSQGTATLMDKIRQADAWVTENLW